MIRPTTPGVYVQEINAFGSSIIHNETAVPVFIGFTEKANQENGEELKNVGNSTNVKEPVLIRSMLEYEQFFGNADTTGVMVVSETVDSSSTKESYSVIIKTEAGANYSPGLMYPSVSNFFANGGGNCYILSIGDYSDFLNLSKAAVDMEFIESAINLAETATLLVPTDLIRFGATDFYSWATILTDFCEANKKYFCILDVIQKNSETVVYDESDIKDYRENVNPNFPSYAAAYFPYLKSLSPYAYSSDLNNIILVEDGSSAKPLTDFDDATIEGVKAYLSTNYINMPPSPFVAGIYSRLDNASGVWTPPANVSPSGVTGPLVSITNAQQADMNVDSTGKSVNAIRSFTGKGTLVWGARTNDGNSMDWRYINVRRLFIAMETDISSALEAYVFKPNVHNTWVEVKTMIESYLFGLFKDGAFAGQTPATSYQVMVGLGTTMTDEDVLNGIMKVSIQIAPVRPAEFIVLSFSQQVGQ